MMSRTLFTLSQVCEITGGSLLCRPPASVRTVSHVVVDSREVVPGTLFAALTGEHTDGHHYLIQAAASGAVMLLVDPAKVPKDPRTLAGLKNTAVIAVADPLTALQKLAAHWVSRHPSLVKIAVTGSSGKTTTKDMIAAILSQMGTVVKTPGNRNSEIGLPLSLFSIDSDHQFGVFELGIGGKGEMDRLISVYSPDYGVMTNIGPAHIANFGSIEAIAQEKSKLFHPGIRRGYIYEHNVWKQYVNSLRNLSCREFGQEGTGGFCWAKPLGLDGWSICYEDRVFVLRHVGRHNLLNALAAVTIARDLGAEPHHIAAGLEALEPAAGRSRIVPGKVTVIEDSYNANTDSTGSIIDYMGGLSWKGRKAVVLGSMKELGETAERAHARIGRKVKTLAPSAAFLFGKEMESAYAVLRRSRSVGKLFFTESYEELEREVTGYVREGDLLLLKGSRAMAMERLLKPLAMVS